MRQGTTDPIFHIQHGPPPCHTDGEAQNPGPVMSLLQANSTSLNTQWKTLLALSADVYAISEPRLADAGQKHFSRKANENGYKAIWGAPCKRHRFARVAPGGVAVILKKEMQARQIEPNTQARKELWSQGRLMHVALWTGNT